MILVVGLGNPGEKYEKTRHNLGFMVLDALAQEWNLSPCIKRKLSSLVCHQRQKSLVLAWPQTMMNTSGLAVGKLAYFYKIKPGDIWIIHDDIDLSLGKIKIKKGGGSAGHRGVESIAKQLGTDQFVRFRLGVDRPDSGSSEQEVEDYVLADFRPEEKSAVEKMIKETVKSINEK